MAYNLAVFVHIVSALALGGTNAIIIAAIIQARRAQTAPQIRLWLGLVRANRRIPPVAGLLVIASGLYLAITAWGWQTPWIDVALIAVLAMVVIPARFIGPRIGAVGEGLFEAVGEAVPPSLRHALTNSVLWSAILLNNALFLGIVFLMTLKPDLIGSLATIVIVAIAGIVLAQIWRPAAQATRTLQPQA